MKRLTIISTSLILALCVSGCAVTTAGVKPGDERNMARSINDINADRLINARLKRTAGFSLGKVEVEVAEGIVVLSGSVPRQEDRIEAERIAWSAPNIVQVGNELMVKGKQSFTSNAKDGILSNSVSTRLLADKYVKGRNFNVESYEGIVYLLGVARTQEELERAARIASTTKGAKEVISYVRVAGSPIAVQSGSARNANLNAPVSQPVPLPTQRALPEFLTQTPTQPGAVAAIPAPVQLQGPKDIPAPMELSPATPLLGPTAPAQISDMGDRLGKEFPTIDELGAYRTGQSGEAVSIIESEPYYIDPETGEQIPVSFLKNLGPR